MDVVFSILYIAVSEFQVTPFVRHNGRRYLDHKYNWRIIISRKFEEKTDVNPLSQILCPMGKGYPVAASYELS